MSEYVKTLVYAVVCTGVVFSLLPKEGAEQYARFSAGLMVLWLVLSPVLANGTFPDVSLESVPLKPLITEEHSYVKAAFETELAERIGQEVLGQTGYSCECKVLAETDETGTVCEIKQIEISPYNETIGQTVSKLCGISEERIVESK